LLEVITKKETGYKEASRQYFLEQKSLSLIRILKGILGFNNNLTSNELETEDKEAKEE